MLDNTWSRSLGAVILFVGCSAGPADSGNQLPGGSAGSIGVGGSGSSGKGSIGTGGTIGPPGPGSAGTAPGSGGIQGGFVCDGVGKTLKGVLRDFKPDTNPDFEPQLGSKGTSAVNVMDPGIVKNTIDPLTMKPAYNGAASGTITTYGATSFESWFRDTPNVNLSIDYTLEFTGPDANGVYTYDAPGGFLPIDDGAGCPATPQTPCLFGNTVLMGQPYPHNYSMTFELHVNFVYRPGMKFTFSGDDDVWVYINNQLVIDLGGIHAEVPGTVELDRLGLTAMSTYRLDFFWAERHLTLSNFRIDTSLEFVDCGIEVVR
jgi:fibro-slime domain-containing protein